MSLVAMADNSEYRRAGGAIAPGRRRRRWLLWSALTLAVLLICAVLMLALLQQPVTALAGIESKAHALKLVGVACQACVIAWIGWRWHRIVAWGRLRGVVQKHEHRQVLALRAKVVGLLVVYLLLVPIGPGTIYRLFMR